MLTKVQTLRSSVTKNRPASGSQVPGVQYINFADLQLGVMNASGNAQDLLAVRYFSASANYAAGDIVVEGGKLWICNAAINAQPFNPGQWTEVGTGGTTVETADTPPSNPKDGDLWYNSANGQLHVWFVDVDSAQWVSVSGLGAGGSGGTAVEMSDTPPANPTAGMEWFNTSDAQLYIYYNDGNSSQWVSTAGPAGGGEAYVPPTYTPGAVLFGGLNAKSGERGAPAEDPTAFHWDATNKRLGIGTSTPTNELDLKGSFYVSGGDNYIDSDAQGCILHLSYAANSVGPWKDYIAFYDDTKTNSQIAALGFNGGTSFKLFTIGANDLELSSTEALILSAGATEKARITKDGNLGIGTTIPNNRITINNVAGGASAINFKTNEVVHGFIGGFGAASGSWNAGRVEITASHPTGAQLLLKSTKEMVLNYAASNPPDSVLRLTTGGSGQNEVARFTTDGDFLLGSSTNIPWGTRCYIEQAVGSKIAALTAYHADGTKWAIETVLPDKSDRSAGIQGNGQIWSRASATISTWSDARLKENIKDYSKGLTDINSLTPRVFDWKDGSGKDVANFIAQEFETVFPEYVSHDDKGIKSIAPAGIIPALVNAIKELTKRVEEMESKI